MIAFTCRRCGSTQLRKNGHTASTQQKFHCKACNFYGTLDTKDQERAHRRATVEKLRLERLSQRAIARTVGMSRSTVATILKKSPDTDWRDHPAIGRTTDPGTRRIVVLRYTQKQGCVDLARLGTANASHCWPGLWRSHGRDVPASMVIAPSRLAQAGDPL
jgi:hypothetical protein